MDSSDLTSAAIRAEILSLSTGRFIAEGESFLGSIIDEITPLTLNDKSVLSLKREGNTQRGVRTLLITVLDHQDMIKTALQWAAAIKDELVEPENGDIYLFAAFKDKSISTEQCTAIEANDRICRRYVLRPNETIQEFLARTFIAPVIGDEKSLSIADPLNLALEKTANKYEWLSSKEQQSWRKALLSGKSASEIISQIFK